MSTERARVGAVVGVLLLVGAARYSSAQPAPQSVGQCALAGTYDVNQGQYFVRFDGEGSWYTYTTRPQRREAPTASQGRYTLRGETLSFDAESSRCAENFATYRVLFAQGCQRFDLMLRTDGCHLTQQLPPLHFTRLGDL